MQDFLLEKIFVNEATDQYQQKRYDYLIEDISNSENTHFFSPMTQEVLANDLQNVSSVLFYDFAKRFISALSCGFVHIDVTCIIIDSLLTKRFIYKNDPYLMKALAVIVFLLKDEGIMEAKTIYEVLRKVEQKGKTVHEYEFFKVYKSLFFKEGDDPKK